jgi:hypothetical protein
VSREEEGDIVRGWLEREERRGYRVGQFWYLVAIDWWKSWTDYVTYRVSMTHVLVPKPFVCRIVTGRHQNEMCEGEWRCFRAVLSSLFGGTHNNTVELRQPS